MSYMSKKKSVESIELFFSKIKVSKSSATLVDGTCMRLEKIHKRTDCNKASSF